MRLNQLTQRIARHAKIIGVVSAVMVFGSWVLTTLVQSRVTATEARLAMFAASIEAFSRERQLLARLDSIGTAVDALRGVDARTKAEQAVAVFDRAASTAEVRAAVQAIADDISQRGTERELLFAEEVERIRAFAAEIERQTNRDPIASALFGLTVLSSRSHGDPDLLKSPLTAIDTLVAEIKVIDDEDRRDVSGFGDIGAHQERAKDWLRRRREREVKRTEKMAAVRRSALLLAHGAAALRASAEAKMPLYRKVANDVELAALVIFAVGSVLAISSKYLETRAVERVASPNQGTLN